ncbi:MAG: hypothetical protein Tsb009_29490 [Planctomycetaceae bacterium]
MVGVVVILIVVTAGMVSTTWVQFLKGSLLVIFSAVLTLMILNRGFNIDESQSENLNPFEASYEEFAEPTDSEELVTPTGEWKNYKYIRFKSLEKNDKRLKGEITTWVEVTYDEGKTGFLPCQTKTKTADGKILVNGLPWGKGEGEKDIQPVGLVMKLPPVKKGESSNQKNRNGKSTSSNSQQNKSAGRTQDGPTGSSFGAPTGADLGQPGGVQLGQPAGGVELGQAEGVEGNQPSASGSPDSPEGESSEGLNGESDRTKTGPLGPLEFFSTLQESEVILWGKHVIKDDAGNVTTVYYPKPTKGSDILKPGNHPRFKGIRSDEPADKLNFLSLMLALFCGTAALPHILIRYYTVKDQASARKSTIVGIGSIGFFYILTLFLGLGAMTSGAMDVTNSNMAAPLLAKSMANWLFAVISAIAFTTVLGTVSGLIVASSGAVVHDLMGSVLKIEMNDHSKVRVAKIASVVVGGIAIILGILFEEMNVSYLVGWAFSVAASANLPSLVMLLFWRGTTKQGIAAAIFVGMISSLGWILLSGDTYSQVYGLDANDSIIPFSQPGIVTIPLGFLTLIVVSLMTRKRDVSTGG